MIYLINSEFLLQQPIEKKANILIMAQMVYRIMLPIISLMMNWYFLRKTAEILVLRNAPLLTEYQENAG